MKYEQTAGTAFPAIKIMLYDNELVNIENGSMVYHTESISIKGRTNGNGTGIKKVFSALGKSVTGGESLFVTEAKANGSSGMICIAPALPGDIMKLPVGRKQWRLNTGAFLAKDVSIDLKMRRQKLGKAIFGGTGGLFVMETEGEGDLLINSFGSILPVQITPNSPLTIDNEHVVAWESNLNYKISIASGMIGFTTGEGLVNTFSGEGLVYIQTRNIASFFALNAAAATNSGNSTGNVVGGIISGIL